MTIRAITFDFWCTLFRDAHGEARQQIRIDALAEASGAHPDKVAAALKVVWAEFMRHHIEEQQTLCPEDAVRLAAESLGVTLGPAVTDDLARVFAEAVLEYSPEPIEGAVEAVRAAAARYPVGVISDSGVSPGSSLRQLLERHAFTPHFKVMTFSDEVGVAKPQRPMFDQTAEALGVAPSELLHIGDLQKTDIAGAQAVGAKAALFTGENGHDAASTTADYVFTSWAQFVDALPELG